MKRALFVYLITLPFSILAQKEMEFSMEIRVVSEETNKEVELPSASLVFSNEDFVFLFGDSLGCISFNERFNPKINSVRVQIKAEGHYSSKDLLIQFDTSLKELKIDTLIVLPPEIVCADSWTFPNLIFNSNSAFLDSASQVLFQDDQISEWIKNVVIPLKCQVELIGYVDLNESNTVGVDRLQFIQTKLNKLGLLNENIIIINKAKADYYFNHFLDGCHPYYMFNVDPLLINKEYLNSISIEKKEYYQSLRRTVVVNLVKLN